MNTPKAWLEHLHLVPALKNAVVWKSIREWSLSEVWRVTMPGGNTMIAKKGFGENSRETSVYNDLLRPLKIDSPIVYNVMTEGSVGILLLEDLKGKTIEEHPDPHYFILAARKLAELRKDARTKLANKGIPIKDSFYLKQDKVINDLYYSYQHHQYLELNQDVILEKTLNVLPGILKRLYEQFPVTVTHNDFYPKNLLINNRGVKVIDWANAKLSPHLGDLYCLISSAEEFDVTTNELIAAYTEGLDEEWTRDIEWQITVGGICWSITMIRWLIDYGVEAIPDSKEWIPDLIREMDRLVDSLN